MPGDNAIIEVTYWGLGTAKRAFNQSFYSPLYLSSSIPLTSNYQSKSHVCVRLSNKTDDDSLFRFSKKRWDSFF